MKDSKSGVGKRKIGTKDMGNTNFKQDPKGMHDGKMPRGGSSKGYK